MIARVARPLVKLALLGLLLWVAQRALTRWVNGPKAEPSSAPWPTVSGGDEAARDATSPPTPAAEESAARETKPKPESEASAETPPTATPAAAPTAPPTAPPEVAPTATPEAATAATAEAKAPAKRAAKKAAAAGKTAPGKIVAANKVRGPAKKASRAASPPLAPTPPTSPASPAKLDSPESKRTAAARIVPTEKRASATSKWLPPDGEACPPTHQVKAKIASMIYHLPGMASYARSTPDRCYATAEDAEADGFARAKR